MAGHQEAGRACTATCAHSDAGASVSADAHSLRVGIACSDDGQSRRSDCHKDKISPHRVSPVVVLKQPVETTLLRSLPPAGLGCPLHASRRRLGVRQPADRRLPFACGKTALLIAADPIFRASTTGSRGTGGKRKRGAQRSAVGGRRTPDVEERPMEPVMPPPRHHSERIFRTPHVWRCTSLRCSLGR